MKIRVMGNPMFVDMANSMGANGVAMGYDQVFSALQTGVVDGAENNPPSFVFDNHYQVAKFYTIDEHLIVPEMLVMSKKILELDVEGRPGAGGEISPRKRSRKSASFGTCTKSRRWIRRRPPASRSLRCPLPTRKPSRTR